MTVRYLTASQRATIAGQKVAFLSDVLRRLADSSLAIVLDVHLAGATFNRSDGYVERIAQTVIASGIDTNRVSENGSVTYTRDLFLESITSSIKYIYRVLSAR